jgi:hypothetical protein
LFSFAAHNTAQMKNLTLKVTDTGRKNGRFHYQIFEGDTVLCDRHSNKGGYVAALVSGQPGTCSAPFFFSRLDLVGKSDSKHLYESGKAYGLAVIAAEPKQQPKPYQDPNGPTGHGDICMSDADPGL